MAKDKKDKKGKNKKEAPAISDADMDERETPVSEGEEGAASEELDLGDKKKGSKTIFIIIGAVVLLIGAGAGVYFSGMLDGLLGKDKAAESGEHAEAGDAASGEEGDAKKDCKPDKEGKGCSGAAFMELPDLVVNLSTNQGQPRYLKLKVQLELMNEGDKAAVEAIAPRVIDHFQTYLRELRISDLRGSAGIYRLRQELLARVNAAADPIKVKDVLFQEILIQ